MFTKIIFTILTISLFTKNAYAQIGLNPNKPDRGIKVNFSDPASTFGIVIQNTILLLFTVGALGFTIMFLWGAVGWILSGGDKEKIAGARRRIVTAIIGLVLLSLTFVIMQIVGQVLGIGSLTNRTFEIPRLTR